MQVRNKIHLTRLEIIDLFEFKDGKLFWKCAKSSNVKVGDEAGTTDSNGYRRIKIDGIRYRSHRLIYYVFKNAEPDYIDHRDGNKLNNRIGNLRRSTQSQNLTKQKQRSTNTSGRTGVYWNRRDKNWRARIEADGKVVNLGCFDDKQEAIDVRRKAEDKYFGKHVPIDRKTPYIRKRPMAPNSKD